MRKGYKLELIVILICSLLSACSFTFQLENGYAVNTNDGQVTEDFDSGAESEIEALEKIDHSTSEKKLLSK